MTEIINNCLSTEFLGPGIIRCQIRLDSLLKEKNSRKMFESKLSKFLSSDPAFQEILQHRSDTLTYLSEEIIPSKRDTRPPLVLLFGNPAPHSVKAGMMFSYEGLGREHRIWKIFQKVGLISFNDSLNAEISNEAKNRVRKRMIFDCDYDSPFRIAFIPFFTLPTTSSNPPWSGVAGIWRLFGNHATRKIAEAESERIKKILKVFMPDGGTVIVFQKDAFRFLNERDNNCYSLKKCMSGSLCYELSAAKGIVVYSAPPTRLLLGKKPRDVLANIIQNALSKSTHI